MANRLIKSPRDLVSGVVLILFAAVAVWALGNLPMGTLKVIGPAMLPKSVAFLIALGGAILILLSILREGEPLARWQLRGPVFVLAGLLVFAATIKTPGFLVAAPLATMIAGWGSHEVRPRELIVFSIAITLSCIVLFNVLLGQGLPVLIIPGTSIKF
jgi:putative tricarboxylic transport membrane protein